MNALKSGSSLILLAGALLVAAPARAQSKQELQLLAEQRQTQELVQRMLLEMAKLTEQLRQVNTTLNTRIDDQISRATKNYADLKSQIDSMSSTSGAVSEQLRDNTVKINRLALDVEAVKKGMEMLTQFVTQALSQSSQTAASPDAPAGSSSPSGSSALPPSASSFFDQAWSAYMAGQNDVAIQGFQEYLRRFPGSPDAAKAQFYIGEANFNFNPGKFAEAAAAYDLVVTTDAYKGTEYVPQAYYKQGLAYEALKKPELAKKNYELLRRDFKDTSWAISATNMLRKMGAIK